MTKRSVALSLLFLFSLVLGTPELSAAPGDKNDRSLTRQLYDEILDNAEPEAEEEPSIEGPSAYRIGAQNLLQIKIFGEAGVNQLYRVDEDGNIKHALVGRVKLGGLTVSEAEKLMEGKLSDGYIINPQLNIFVLEYSHFSIIGEVRKPGNYEISGRTSVIRAVSMAGGFTPVADQRAIQVIRRSANGSEEKLKVDIGSSALDLQEDDVVIVPKSFF